MSTEKGSFVKGLGDIIKKTASFNMTYMTEAMKLMQGINLTNSDSTAAPVNKKQVATDVLGKLVKLNMDYATNFIDMGMNLTKELVEKINPTQSPVAAPSEPSEMEQPAFQLDGAVAPGNTLQLQFMLDNDKDVPIVCELKRSSYSLEGTDITADFDTKFDPPVFTLAPKGSQKVDVLIVVPEGTLAGTYRCKVLVQGFEHVFFALSIEVTP